jgi:hypothetical protein
MFEVVNGNAATGTHQLHDVLVNNEYYPASGSFVNCQGAERVHVLIELGELADTVAFELYESDAVDGTEDQISATYYKHTVAADDDGEYVTITIETARMSSDHYYLTTKVSGVSGNNYAGITYLLEKPGNLPASSDALPSASQNYYNG